MSSNSTFRILVSTDNHTGYAEDKPVIGNDSFDAFEEVLQHARDQDVDFILLGGDLFHKSEPDRSTVHKVTELLRDYVLGDRDLPFEFLSEPSDVFGFSKFQRVNFEDANINIGMPIFTIHGNHDDFSGKGLLALDNFHDSGYLNLFGKFTDVEKIEVKPILLRKVNKIKFFTLPEEFDDYFKILVVHQNRPPRSTVRSTGSYLPFEKIPKFFDLVIWGHEHACLIGDMNYERTGEPYILQPGSSVATSLCPDESIPKGIALLQIKKTSMKINRIPLERARQVLYDVLDLNKKDPHVKLTKTQVRTKEMKDEKLIYEKIESMLRQAKEERGENQPNLPRVRLKVIYSGNWLNIPPVKPALIGEKYKNRVANPSELIKVHFIRPEKEKKAPESGIELSNPGDTTTVFDLLKESIKQRAQNGLGLLQLDGMEELVKEHCLTSTKAGMKKDALRNVIQDQVDNYMSRIRHLNMDNLGSLPPSSEVKGLVKFAVDEMIKSNRNQVENPDVSSTSINSNDENIISEMGQPNDNEIYATSDGRPAKMPRADDDSTAIELSKFQFKEVLGGDPSRKSIFILIEHVENKTQAIMIMDKLAFAENGEVISSWLPVTKLEVKAINDIYHNYIAYMGDQFSGVKTTIIYPCTEKHIIKYRRKELYIAYETPEDYNDLTLSYIKEKAVSLQWVYNVLEGKSEVDRVVHHDKDPINGFLLAMDLKWSGSEIDSLYLQAIVNRRDILSMLMFCPTCGRLTTLEDAGGQFKFVCSGCHFKMPVNGEIRSRLYPRLKDIDDVLGGPNVWENAQVTEERCPKCSHDRAYFMQLQTRSADEPMTIFYRCANVDCAHRWKD